MLIPLALVSLFSGSLIWIAGSAIAVALTIPDSLSLRIAPRPRWMFGPAIAVVALTVFLAWDGPKIEVQREQKRQARAVAEQQHERDQAVATAAEAAKRKAETDAQAELTQASLALFSARARAPTTEEEAIEFKHQEDLAQRRWERAQRAVYGPNWREHEAAEKAGLDNYLQAETQKTLEKMERERVSDDLAIARGQAAIERNRQRSNE